MCVCVVCGVYTYTNRLLSWLETHATQHMLDHQLALEICGQQGTLCTVSSHENSGLRKNLDHPVGVCIVSADVLIIIVWDNGLVPIITQGVFEHQVSLRNLRKTALYIHQKLRNKMQLSSGWCLYCRCRCTDLHWFRLWLGADI